MLIVNKYTMCEPSHTLIGDVDLLFLKDMNAVKAVAVRDGFPIQGPMNYRGYMRCYTYQQEHSGDVMNELHMDVFSIPIKLEEAFYDNKRKDSDD